LVSRIIIGKIRDTKLSIVRSLWFVVDIVATFIIFSVGVTILFLVLLSVDGNLRYLSIEDILHEIYQLFHHAFNPTADSNSGAMAIVIWTTYFTSVWVWLYIASHIVTRLIGPLIKSVRIVQYLLPVDAKPLQSVCTVMALISCLMTWVILAPLELL